jgi:hypothetical protein
MAKVFPRHERPPELEQEFDALWNELLGLGKQINRLRISAGGAAGVAGAPRLMSRGEFSFGFVAAGTPLMV